MIAKLFGEVYFLDVGDELDIFKLLANSRFLFINETFVSHVLKSFIHVTLKKF